MVSIVECVEKNQQRILRLCECVIDLIDEVSSQIDYGEVLDWVRYEIQEIRDDINNSN